MSPEEEIKAKHKELLEADIKARKAKDYYYDAILNMDKVWTNAVLKTHALYRELCELEDKHQLFICTTRNRPQGQSPDLLKEP